LTRHSAPRLACQPWLEERRMVRAAGFEPAHLPREIASDSQGDLQKTVPVGHGLSQVVAAWAELPDAFKAAILAIVRTATNKGGQ
jgi:hypothetical protein